MSTEATIRVAVSGDIPRLVAMWCALYEHQHEHGMRLPLAADAAERWARDIAQRLDSPVARVYVAECDYGLIGFVTAQVKRLPPMYDPSLGKTGAIAEMWVEARYRSRGVGAQLVEAAEHWMADSGARTAELQVVVDNPGGLRFWEARGWKPECCQLRRELP